MPTKLPRRRDFGSQDVVQARPEQKTIGEWQEALAAAQRQLKEDEVHYKELKERLSASKR